MQDKAKLGKRYTCFECGTKFYDLNRPQPICPECMADQTKAKVQDPLSTRGKMPEEADQNLGSDSVELDDEELDGEGLEDEIGED